MKIKLKRPSTDPASVRINTQIEINDEGFNDPVSMRINALIEISGEGSNDRPFRIRTHDPLLRVEIIESTKHILIDQESYYSLSFIASKNISIHKSNFERLQFKDCRHVQIKDCDIESFTLQNIENIAITNVGINQLRIWSGKDINIVYCNVKRLLKTKNTHITIDTSIIHKEKIIRSL